MESGGVWRVDRQLFPAPAAPTSSARRADAFAALGRRLAQLAPPCGPVAHQSSRPIRAQLVWRNRRAAGPTRAQGAASGGGRLGLWHCPVHRDARAGGRIPCRLGKYAAQCRPGACHPARAAFTGPGAISVSRLHSPGHRRPAIWQPQQRCCCRSALGLSLCHFAGCRGHFAAPWAGDVCRLARADAVAAHRGEPDRALLPTIAGRAEPDARPVRAGGASGRRPGRAAAHLASTPENAERKRKRARIGAGIAANPYRRRTFPVPDALGQPACAAGTAHTEQPSWLGRTDFWTPAAKACGARQPASKHFGRQ